MHPRLLPLAALASASAILYSGCEALSPAETTGPFSGANAQMAAANINRAGTAGTGDRMAGSAPISNTTVAVTAIIAKHQASVRQLEVARQRAQVAYKKLVAKQAASVKAAAAPGKPQPGKVAGEHQPKPGAKTATTHEPKPGTDLADGRRPKVYRVPRYIAVETVKDAKDAPGTQKAVMIWDTQAQEIVGNNVYDIGNPPAVGATSRFETFSAEYVGAGL